MLFALICVAWSSSASISEYSTDELELMAASANTATTTPSPSLPFRVVKGYRYLGCYHDDSVRNIAPTWVNVSSLGECQRWCASSQTKYFAVQWGKQCFCGNSYGGNSAKYGHYNDFYCDISGSGMGRAWFNAVYSTTLPPCSNYGIPATNVTCSCTMDKSSCNSTATFDAHQYQLKKIPHLDLGNPDTNGKSTLTGTIKSNCHGSTSVSDETTIEGALCALGCICY